MCISTTSGTADARVNRSGSTLWAEVWLQCRCFGSEEARSISAYFYLVLSSSSRRLAAAKGLVEPGSPQPPPEDAQRRMQDLLEAW